MKTNKEDINQIKTHDGPDTANKLQLLDTRVSHKDLLLLLMFTLQDTFSKTKEAGGRTELNLNNAFAFCSECKTKGGITSLPGCDVVAVRVPSLEQNFSNIYHFKLECKNIVFVYCKHI